MVKASIILFLTAFILFANSSKAQLIENFADGDFTNEPAWTGNMMDWIVDNNKQLQSNNTVANATFYLSTANTLATTAEWNFFTRLDFNPSSANYVDVFLTASASDLSKTNTTGYFVRIGNTDDEICLYRKNADGSIIKLIDGLNGTTNNSINAVRVKVIRNVANDWILMRDLTGNGSSYVTEGTKNDATYITSAYFGVIVKQSTAGFFQKHYFDDIEIKTYVPDITPPSIQSVIAVSPKNVDILFSEEVEKTGAENGLNYNVNNSIGSPVTAVRDVNNAALVHLTFTASFSNGLTNTLTVKNIKDPSGNVLNNASASFSFYIPQRYDVIIDEIFADPTPPVSLPNAEFIELKNISNHSINLEGWKVHSVSTTSGAFQNYLLKPDSFLILTSANSAALFSSKGNILGIPSFPSLDNTGTTIWLTSKEGVTLHSVSYLDKWYQNDVKSMGGWSLEMIDTKNPCSGASNWKASLSVSGGTPGLKNSIDANNPDVTAPALVRAIATDSITVVLTFDEPMDSTTAANTTSYSVSNGIGFPVSATAIGPAFNTVRLKLRSPVEAGIAYTIVATNITDCSANIINMVNTSRFGLARVIYIFDLVINEILFNPKPTSVDYVEIYNRSGKILNLKDLYIANRSLTTQVLGSLRQLTTDDILIFPGDFFVLSENNKLVKKDYLAKNPDNFIDVTMPSLPDDEGFFVLLNGQGRIVDELHYNEKWHFVLLDNQEGVSLERIAYDKPTNSSGNWFSAASTAGYGTPGYQNSQIQVSGSVPGEISIIPKTYSPDQDGYEDFTTINYQLPNAGYVANITIFDAAGRPVKALVRNATLALSGSFRWDGLNDKLLKVPLGVYIVFTEIFNLNGGKKSFKNTVVVASRF